MNRADEIEVLRRAGLIARTLGKDQNHTIDRETLELHAMACIYAAALFITGPSMPFGGSGKVPELVEQIHTDMRRELAQL